jgi:hypothetical protein
MAWHPRLYFNKNRSVALKVITLVQLPHRRRRKPGGVAGTKTVSSTSVKSNRRRGWTADKKLHCPHYTRELRRCPAEGEAEKGDGQCLC